MTAGDLPEWSRAVDRRRVEGDAPARRIGVGKRDRGEQGLRVRVPCVVEQCGGGSDLDDLTEIHHRDA
jgi:hypothetical protein